MVKKKRTILSGRIYPTIQNCVNNRYKIVAGYIAVLGFLLVKGKCQGNGTLASPIKIR